MGLNDAHIVDLHHAPTTRQRARTKWFGVLCSLAISAVPSLAAAAPLPTRQELSDAIAAGAKHYEIITLEYVIDDRLWDEDARSIKRIVWEIKFERSDGRFRFRRRFFDVDSATGSRELKTDNFGVFDGKNSYKVQLPTSKNDVQYARALIAPGEDSTVITKHGPYNLFSFLWGNGPDIALADSVRDPRNDVDISEESQDVAGCKTVHASLTMRDANGTALGHDDYWFAFDHGCLLVKRVVASATGEVVNSWVAEGVEHTPEGVWFPTSIRMTYPQYDPDKVFKLTTINRVSGAPIPQTRFQDVIPTPASVNNTIDGTEYFLPSPRTAAGGQPPATAPLLSRTSWAVIGCASVAAFGVLVWRHVRD